MRGRPEALATDWYELTMIQSYFALGLEKTAVFEFFVRNLPPSRSFLIAAGLEQALDYLEELRFEPGELDWLARSGRFSSAAIDRLRRLRFTGSVDAMPEGTVFFANEPILRVTAPLPEAQLAETRLVNLLQFQTLVASKAARCVLAAPGKRLVDFGFRRAHGAEAGLLAARASYLAGFAGTSAVKAGWEFGIPLFGTMAHSFVQAFEDEAEAFSAYSRANPADATLLLDTYDTEAAARKTVETAKELLRRGIEVKAVRIDSGDLGAHARRVREILDAAGLGEVKIVASGGLDERSLSRLVSEGAPIDAFGIGTQLATSSDAPSLDCVYKLQEYAGRPIRKRSEGKSTWPGRKQVWRRSGGDGRWLGDVLTLEGDPQEGEPLLAPVMRRGRRLAPSPALESIRDRTRVSLARLPERLRGLEPARAYPVYLASALVEAARAADKLAGV
jgi:nicotinate phosphoribosyltransferase